MATFLALSYTEHNPHTLALLLLEHSFYFNSSTEYENRIELKETVNKQNKLQNA